MPAPNPDHLVVQPIIIKKKVVHAGHHGGAWKVAYADFVTAMMALFIVLWLLSSSDPVKKAVAGYFRDPTGHSNENGSGQSGASENIGIGKDDMGKLKEKLAAAIRQSPAVAKLKDQVQMTVTGEGLRIELLESAVNTFFETGSAQPTPSGEEMLQLLASELGKLPNRLSVEGHTDAKPYVSANGYSNWELSTDRANSARKLVQQAGVRGNQVADVRGYADQRLRKPEDPTSASNRRVSIVVKYQAPGDPPVHGTPEPTDGKAAPAASKPAPAASNPAPAAGKAAPSTGNPANKPAPVASKPSPTGALAGKDKP
jgi:chemotaxis protein MotB